MLLASEVAARPSGAVTKVCSSPASKEGAFRLLENLSVRHEAIRASMQAAALRRCKDHDTVFVPVDATSLRIIDTKQDKGLGPIGSWGTTLRGVHVMSALAVDRNGGALGIVSQRMWVREKARVRISNGQPTPGGESAYWVDVLEDARAMFAANAPTTRPWFQLDRGADCWQVLSRAHESDLLLTVRAVHNRYLDSDIDRLRSAVESAPVIATKKLAVPARPPSRKRKRAGNRTRLKWWSNPRPARVATLKIRAVTVPIVVRTPNETLTLPFNAVWVHETGNAEDPIDWLLLTTHPVATRAQVLEVVRGYAMRWRIEDFHRAWKRGLCNVEDTQLRSRDAIFKWATILAAVATRAMRLTQLARSSPTIPASSELSPREIEALIALRDPRNYDGHELTLEEAVRWIAEVGGYTGPWNGPPGTTTVGRGLSDVLLGAKVLERHKKKR